MKEILNLILLMNYCSIYSSVTDISVLGKVVLRYRVRALFAIGQYFKGNDINKLMKCGVFMYLFIGQISDISPK